MHFPRELNTAKVVESFRMACLMLETNRCMSMYEGFQFVFVCVLSSHISISYFPLLHVHRYSKAAEVVESFRMARLTLNTDHMNFKPS